MSGSVPIYRSQERIQRQPIVDASTGEGGAMATLSRAMGDLQNTFAGIGRDMRQEREEREIGEDRRDILTRPMRDEAGDWGTRRGRLRNEAILARLTDEALVEGREVAVRFRQEAGGDPARFQALFSGWAEGRTSQMPEWVRQQSGSAFSRIANEHVQSLSLQQIAREDRNQAAGWEAHLQVRTQELEGLVRAGRMDGPEYRAAHEAVIGLLDRGVRENRLSAEAANVQRQALADRVAGVAVVRAGMDRLAEGATAEQVLGDFDAQADRAAMPMAQRERLRNLLEARINDRRAVQAEQRTEVGIEWTDMRARITGGVPVEATEVDALARRAENSGARATAAEIRRTQEVYSDLRDAQALSLPQLRQRHAATVQRVATDPAASSRQAILGEMLGQAVTRRQEEMRRDPLGTAARTHRLNPDGGELIPLDMSSPEKLGEGLAARAQQARRLGALEGMADSMPVLTSAEAAQLGGLVRNGTRDQQMALLTSLNRLPADTMRRTMEGMLPGQENERDPRVLSFMAAAGVMQRGDSRLAIEIVSGEERLRSTPAPALNAPAVDRLIEERIGQAYGTNPAAYAAVRAAARAVYAERAATGLDPSQPGGSRSDPALSQTFSSSLMERVLRQVAPTITYNGQMVPPPVRNGQVMTEAAFREQMQGIPSHVLAGVRAANNSPVTPDHVRRYGALMAVGEGRYALTISGHRVNRADGRPFVLDMRQDWPAAPAAGDPAAPRGIRNNNPLNLEYRSSQPGVTGSDGRFGRYQTMEDGLFAGAQQVLRWVDRGDTTLTALISRWAPPSENNTAAYVQRVARDTGLSATGPINWRDPNVLGSILQSMAHHENGRAVDAEAVRRAVARALT